MTFGPGFYLCGCEPTKMFEIYKKVRVEGDVEVCPEHGEPMYGYLSPQVERPGLGRVIDFSKKGSASTVKLERSEIQDHRDNRSPMEAYMDRQREKAMTSNGHA